MAWTKAITNKDKGAWAGGQRFYAVTGDGVEARRKEEAIDHGVVEPQTLSPAPQQHRHIMPSVFGSQIDRVGQ